MTPELVEGAANRLSGVVRQTPLLSSPFLDEIAGRPLWIKAECLQHTGSFKFRGALSALTALPKDVTGVLAYSSGNHAQGVALAARMRGLTAVIIMPQDAPAVKLANTRALGAEVVTYDRAGGESREEIGTALSAERDLTLVRPYDDPQVIAGQATCGLEIAAQAADAGVTEAEVLVCCGGGGFSSGIALACDMRAPGLRVRTVEPEGFDDVARSLATHTRASNDRMSGSICDAIVTPSPGELTFPILDRLAGPGLAVSDEQALQAMALAYHRLRIVAEPGGAVALAAALFHPELRDSDAPLIVTISGGNVDAPLFTDALTRYPL